jgi:hypothetical protein
MQFRAASAPQVKSGCPVQPPSRSSFGNGLEVGIFLPSYRASHRLTEPIERTSFPSDRESRHTYKRREAPQGLPHYRQLYTGTQAMLYSSVAVVGSPSYKVLLLMMMTGP